ncbi:trichoplein keratin filament-binding protein isoform X2 [Pyrgilauda ruficollis]|uniref:trichoplein keratin filament-binding protein isoform X2 n=1 Tax=Pyrgilauda ruficollis TaxID=221976 RepID=UPI001B86356F|nr:trichoplein keratin filament-binding protein isoform X2 [Pyrgilauda ruficollis]
MPWCFLILYSTHVLLQHCSPVSLSLWCFPCDSDPQDLVGTLDTQMSPPLQRQILLGFQWCSRESGRSWGTEPLALMTLLHLLCLQAESEQQRKHMREAWGDQLTQQNKEEVTKLEEKKHENEYETARGEALERTRQEEEKPQLEKALLQQIEELKLQETKATKLKKEQENLLKQQWELENLEEERKQMEEHRRKKELGRFLKHQCDVQLRRRAQQEADRQILSALLEKEEQDQSWQSVRRGRAVADVAWMKKVIEEQLQLEKEREAELDTIFREEARKIWEKREEEWEREKVARDRLMSEVLAGRQRQIQEKMELNRRAQKESIKYREQLIKELEEAKDGTRREKEQEEEEQRAHRRELQAQGTEHSLGEEEEQQEGSAQQHLEELEQQEAKQGWHSRFYSYPRAAWT